MNRRVLNMVPCLILAGVAGAAPFNVRGGTFANDTTSRHGLSFSSGELVVNHRTRFFGNGAVAPKNDWAWRMFATTPGAADTTTWLGLYPGERPEDWSDVMHTPGGFSLGFGGLHHRGSNAALYNFGWARLSFAPVTSAPANIIGPGEYVWFGQLVASDPMAFPSGDVTILFDGKFDRAELNGRPAIDASGQPIYLISLVSSPGVHQLYLTDVRPGNVDEVGVDASDLGELSKAERKRLKKELKRQQKELKRQRKAELKALKQQQKAERRALKLARKEAKRRALLSGLPIDTFLTGELAQTGR